MDLGTKYRSPRQPRDDIRLQKRLKTANQKSSWPYTRRVAVASGLPLCSGSQAAF